jgi:hypothetical protein
VRIKVATVVNDTGYTFDVDIEQMLVNTLEEQLMEENLLSLGKEEPNLFMESRIVGYKKGNAFKKWMMPGWGSTELAIHCDLKDDKNNLVGSAMSSREIVGGGLRTVGAWETIFKDVANDVAGDLRTQIQAKGYVVKSKIRHQVTDQPRSFVNDFVDNEDGTVTDRATGLMWQKSGSLERLDNRDANKYVKQLISKDFAGYSDWRMPTVEELASLLARERKPGVYLDPVFDYKQIRCWTIDQYEPPAPPSLLGTWLIDFKNGEVSQAYSPQWGAQYGFSYGRQNAENFVKAVRSVK